MDSDSERYLNYKHFFKPQEAFRIISDNFPKKFKKPVLYIGRVYNRPFEQTRMIKYNWLGKFNDVVSYQRIIVRPYLHVFEDRDFPIMRSTKRIKSWKYIKPVYTVHQKVNYFFSVQNELLRNFFHIPEMSRNPLTGPGKYKLGHGFLKPLFAQNSPTDLLRNHFLSTSFNYSGMPKISFNRDFNLLKINNVNVHRIRIPLNYSIFRPHKPRFDYHSSKLIFNPRLFG